MTKPKNKDTTELKLKEQTLGQSDARYRLMYESMTDCFVQIALSGDIVEANRSYLEMLGYTEEEVRKLRYQDITPAKWHEFDQKIVETQVMARGYSDVYEQEYIKKDGTVFPVELRTYLLRNTDGKPFGMWTIIRDITERKRAVEKLRETSVYTRSLIEASLDPLITISPQGKITDVNKATELTTGLSRDKLIGSDFSDYFTEPEKARAIYQRVFDKGLVKDYALAIRHISGSTTDVLYNASVYMDSAGNVAGVFAAARNITEQKQAENGLRESEVRYRRLFESMTDCFIQVTLSGEIVDVNHSFLGMLGYTREEVGRLRYQDIAPAKWYEGQKVFETQVMTRGYSDVYEKEYIRKDGTVFPVELRMFLLRDTDGKPSGMWAIVRDITERKHAEEERIQLISREKSALAEAEAARELDRMKSMFIASTSHELKTPLNAIIGFTSLILDGTSGKLNPEQKKQLEIVHLSGKHLLSLINDIIESSRLDSGKIDLEVSEFDLRKVVDEAVLTLSVLIKEKELKISQDVEDITIKTDRLRLLQCVINLISNAIKYTENGSIKLIVKNMGNNAYITVIDTGIGIKTEDIPKLFAPFVRLQTPLTEKTSGTGLGLYLVKKIAKYLGGDVEVESEFGKGSKFTLRIPVELGYL